MSERAEIIGACDKCHRGYVSFRKDRCMYPGCGGTIKFIDPISNDYDFGKGWKPLPSHLIRWAKSPEVA